MADFDQTQSELDQFLEHQFSEEKPEEKQVTQPEDDSDIAEYLGGDEIADNQQGQVENTNVEVPQQPQVSDQDRMLALERELAATKARAEMFETAIRAGYENRTTTEEPATPKVNLPYGDEDLNFDERLELDYGDANPYIQAIARRVANEMYQKSVVPLQNELNEVRGQLDRQRDVNVQNQKFSIETQLRQVVPDLDQIAYSNEWQSYIRQAAPYSGGTETIANVVQRGIQSGNIKQVVEVINDFKAKRSKGQPQQQQMSPGRSQVSQPVTKPAGKKMLRMSDFERATANFEAGRLSWDKYQRIVDEFNAAMVEGRVNTNK